VSVHVRLRVGGELYALPVENVVEVAELGAVSEVPGAPPAVLGVRNLRGRILPVVDFAALLGVPRTDVAPRVVIAEDDGRRACLAIDEVTQVGELPEPSEEAESELLRGAALDGGDLVGIVDVRRLFDTLEGSRG
jgi:purine-binding chemotaxis protein CheW